MRRDVSSRRPLVPGTGPALGYRRAMPDHSPDDRYDWLYGSDDDRTRRVESPARGRASDDLPPPNLPPPGRGASRPPRGPRRRRPGRWLGLAIAAWLVFLVAVPLYAFSSTTKVAFEPEDRLASQGGTTFLVVGSDSRAGLSEQEQAELTTGGDEGGRGRTDTIMLLHSGAGPAILLSVPRDSIVEVPGYGTTKINAAYAYGGPELLTRTIEQNTGVRVDDYVEIGFGGLVDVVDAVGGVEICPEQDLQDEDSGLDVQAGCQEADGATALAYSRNRKSHQTGDIQRVQSQREVMSGLAGKIASPWTVINPLRYWGVNHGAAGSVAIGESTNPYDLLKFALALRSAMGDGGLSCTVPLADFTVRWDPERSGQVFDAIAADRTGRIGDLCTPDGLPATS